MERVKGSCSVTFAKSFAVTFLTVFEYLKAFFPGVLLPVPEYLYTASFFRFDTPVADFSILYFWELRKPLFLYATGIPLALMTFTFSRRG